MKKKLLRTSSIALACLVGGGALFMGVTLNNSNEMKEVKATGYSYIDWDKATESLVEKSTGEIAVTAIEDSATNLNLAAGWYIVNENATISGSLTLNGRTHIILCDDKTLTITNGLLNNNYGDVSIYGQSEQTGTLTITSTSGKGIRVDSDSVFTVYGGQVSSTGSTKDGGYNTGLDGNAMIYGGSLSLRGGDNGTVEYAGIIGKVTVNGGTFYSRGSQGATEGVAGEIFGGFGFKAHAYKSTNDGATWTDEPLENNTTDANYVKVVADKAYPIIGNEEITTTHTSGEGWSFDIDSFTLILNNYTYEGVCPISAKYGGSAAIYYEGTKTVNIVNNGTNSLNNTTAAESAYGISSYGSFVFDGDGTLTSTSSNSTTSSYGIYSQGSITINSGTINAYGGPAGTEYGLYNDSCGIDCNGACILNGGTIYARGGSVYSGTSSGIYYCSGGLTIGSGVSSFIAIGKSQGLRANTTNAFPGKGWTNEEGTEGETTIEAGYHESYPDLMNLKKVVFVSPVTNVINLINNIGEVEYTDTCKGKIDAARSAYDALDNEAKSQVTNYSTLTDAEAKYAALKGDHDAANAVIKKINDIGEVSYTDECKAKIDDARSSYDTLTDSQKPLVTNLSTLEAAEARYQELAPQGGSDNASFPVWALVLIIVGGVLLLCCGCYFLLFFVFNKWVNEEGDTVRVIKLGKKDGKVRLCKMPCKFIYKDEKEVFNSKLEALDNLK